MNSPACRRTIAAIALVASALAGGPVSARSEGVIELGVSGRTNATPSIAADGQVVAIAWGATGADEKTDVFAAVSLDAGGKFGEAVKVNAVAGEARLSGEMPPRIAVRRVQGGGVEIVVAWTARGDAASIKVARSRDLGRSFSAPLTLQERREPGNRGWPAITIDGRGEVHAIWLDHRAAAPPPGSPSAPHQHGQGVKDGVAMAQKSGLYYASVRLRDTASARLREDASAGQAGAVLVRHERELTKGVCYCCKTTVAVRPDDTIVAAWRHVYPGNLRDIAFSSSRDRGRTFTSPMRVSRDGWEINACPDDGPALAVDGAGTTHIAWPTVVADGQLEGALFYATRKNGGFTARARIPTLGSIKPSHPQIAVDSAGRAVVAWDELVDNRRVVALVTVTNGRRGATFSPIRTLNDDSAGYYPVVAAVSGSVVAAWTSGRPGTSSAIAVKKVPLKAQS
jgi:hypothetical protein